MSQVFSNDYSDKMLLKWQCVGCSKVLSTTVDINLDPIQLLDMGWPLVSVGPPNSGATETPLTVYTPSGATFRAEYVCSCGPQSFNLTRPPTGNVLVPPPSTLVGHAVPQPIKEKKAPPTSLCGDLLDTGGETYVCRLPVSHHDHHQGFPIRQSSAPSIIEPPEELGWTNKSPNRRRP